MGTSFQEMHRMRRKDAFVGRDTESLAFRENLLAPLDDPARRSIIMVNGQGGMGKTTFLKHCREIAEASEAGTAWSDETDTDALEVMESLAEDLGTKEFKKVLNLSSKYREKIQQLEASPDAPQDFARVAGAAIGHAGTKLARRIPVAGAAFDFLDEEKMGEKLGEAAAFIAANTSKKDEAELLLDPIGVISPVFVTALAGVLEKQEVVLFFDTFEETFPHLQLWLNNLLLGKFGQFPRNLQIMIAGRDALDSNVWSDFDPLINRIEMKPLSDQEASSYLASKGVTDLQAIAALVELARGIPLFLAIFAVGPPEASKANESLVDRILRSAPKQLREAAIAGATPQVLNRDVGNLLFGEERDAAFDWLIKMPFVKSVTQGWKYHDVIRAEFLKFARRRSPQGWSALHKKLAAYFSEREEAAVRTGDYAGARASALSSHYHRLISEPKLGLADTIRHALAAWWVDPVAARPWARTLHAAGRDAENKHLREWGEDWLEAINEDLHRNHQPAIRLFSRIISSEVLIEQHSEAYICRSNLYRRQGRFDVAISDMDRALDLDPDEPYVLNRRAALNLDANPMEALQDCERAIDLLEEGDSRRWHTLCLLRVRVLRELFSADIALEALEELDENEQAGRLFLRGELLREIGQFSPAIRDLERSLELDEERSHAGWKEIATAWLEEGNRDEAVEAIRKSLRVIPTCGHCWEMLAQVYAESSPPEEVRNRLLSAIDLESEVGVRPYRAFGIRRSGTPDDACEELQLAVNEDPTNPEVRLWFVEALEEAGRLADAQEQLAECLRLRPEWPAALRLRAMARFREGDFTGAETDWASVTSSRLGDLPTADLASRGLGLSILGKYEQAIEIFDQVLEKVESPEVMYNRAVARSRLMDGRPDEKELERVRQVLLEADRELARRYGTAGLDAIQGKTDAALAALEVAIDLDRDQVASWATTDPAWQELRGTSRFLRLMKEPFQSAGG